jgi:cell division protein ZapE
MNVTEYYENELQTRGYQSDPAQLRGGRPFAALLRRVGGVQIAPLECVQEADRAPGVAAWRLHVGRRGARQELPDGQLFAVVPVQRKTRLHFHEFMREVHRELEELKGHGRSAR